MSLFDLPAPAFNFLDHLMSMALPDIVRLILWAICATGLGIFLYRRLAQANHQTSPTASGSVAVIPLIISTLPTLLIAVWLNNNFEYEIPHPGEKVKIKFYSLVPEKSATAPSKSTDKIAQDKTAQGKIAQDKKTPLKLRIDNYEKAWPNLNGRLVFRDTGSETGAAFPASRIASVVTKRKWWNVFFGNPIGYIPDEFAIEKIKFEATPRKMISVNSYWASNWKLWFVLTLGVSYFLIMRIFQKENALNVS